MKVFKVTVEVWVKGRGKQDALDKLIGDMDYLADLEDDYLNVVAFEHPTEAKFDKEATQRLKEATQRLKEATQRLKGEQA
jgi:hypothetical protein